MRRSATNFEVSIPDREVSIPDRGVVAPPATTVAHRKRKQECTMGYGIGGILVLILVILAIIYFAKRV